MLYHFGLLHQITFQFVVVHIYFLKIKFTLQLNNLIWSVVEVHPNEEVL